VINPYYFQRTVGENTTFFYYWQAPAALFCILNNRYDGVMEKEPVIEAFPPGKPSLTLRREDFEISYFSGGPGGQNVNKSMNGVQLVWHIPEAYLIPARKTRRLISRCMAERSQEQNFRAAFHQLAEKVRQYFYVPPHRRKTRVSKKEKQRRLEDKKRHGQLKKTRARSSGRGRDGDWD
jgi:ribosome-associated protein